MNAANPSSEHVRANRIPGSNRGDDARAGSNGHSHSQSQSRDQPSVDKVRASLKRVRTVAWLMDHAVTIPGTNIKFGLDPIVGLFPGAGDLVSALISAYTVIEAKRLNLPAGVTQRMVGNIALDFLAGLVPALGDALDFLIRANDRNLKLMEQTLRDMGYDV